MKRIRIALVTACAAISLVVWTPDASGIIGGELDGNAHPNVGMVVVYDELSAELGPIFCSGTLISPTIVLTAAHCVDEPGVESVGVTFDPDPLPPDPSDPIDGLIAGTAHWLPRPTADDSGAHGFYESTGFDVAVIELPNPVAITPAQLPTANLLAPFSIGSRNRLFTVVGYGTYRDVDPPLGRDLEFDGVRRTTTVSFKKLTDTLLFVRLNALDSHGGGGGCYGDSGGPIFLGNIVVGEYTGVHNFDLCQAFGSYTRIDAGPARDWLAQFVSLP
jgi:Trypsin